MTGSAGFSKLILIKSLIYNMHKIELVVFDMAGTVVNENNVVYKTLHRAINQNGCFISLNFVLEHGAGKESTKL